MWLDKSAGAALWDHPPASALPPPVRELPAFDGQEVARLLELAVELGVEIVLGMHERRGVSPCNSVLRVAPGAAPFIHRKVMPTYGERLIWAAADGSTLRAWDTPHGPMGTLICWKHWMPLARGVARDGEAVHFALWPGLKEIHQINSRHYAFEGQCFVIATGCVLTRDDVLAGSKSGPADPVARSLLEATPEDRLMLKGGGSAVFGPDGMFVGGPAGDSLATLHATIDLDRLAKGQLRLDTRGHYSRPDIFELRVNRAARPGVTFSDPGDRA